MPNSHDRSPLGGPPSLLCDLDGTLIDSAPDLLTALNGLLRSENRPQLALKEMLRMVGDGVAKLVERAFAATGVATTSGDLEILVPRFLRFYRDNLVKDTVTYPGVDSVLTTLRETGWQMGVCTNKPEKPSRQILQILGLAHLFDAVSGGDSQAVKKPDPGHLMATLDQLNASKERCVMLGDSGNDIRAAQAAGIPVVLVSFGYCREPLHSLGADSIINSFAELPAALAGLATTT